jgi:DNA-binding NtrC family response regulator
VETDESFRRLISDRLRLEGYEVHEACRESEAHRMLLRKDLDVVLLGFTGDKQPALGLLRAIKETQPLVEVILLRSSEDHSLAASIQGMKLGAFDELLIPLDMETLVRRIQEACRRKGQRESAARQTNRTRGGNDRGKRGPNGQGQSPVG